MIRLLVQKSKLPNFRPGKIFDHDVLASDLAYADGSYPISVTVIAGNQRFPNGKRLNLYLKTDGTSLQQFAYCPIPVITPGQTAMSLAIGSPVPGQYSTVVDVFSNSAGTVSVGRFTGTANAVTITGLTASTNYWIRPMARNYSGVILETDCALIAVTTTA